MEPQNTEYSQNAFTLKYFGSILAKNLYITRLRTISRMVFKPNTTIARSIVEILRTKPYRGELADFSILAVMIKNYSILFITRDVQ